MVERLKKYPIKPLMIFQKMHNKTIDDFLPALKFAPDWFVTSNMMKKFHDALLVDDDILFFDADSSNGAFSSDEMAIFSVDLNTNLDDVNIDEDDPIIRVTLMAQRNSRLKQRKAFKKRCTQRINTCSKAF